MQTRVLQRCAGALAVCALVLLVLVETGWGPLLAVDRFLARELHHVALDEPFWTRTNRILTDWVWDSLTMRLLAAAVAVFLVCRGAVRLAVWVGATTLIGLLVQHGVKAVVGRPRPDWLQPVDSGNGYAFPSGHAMATTVTCGLLLVLVLRHGSGLAGPLWRAAAWGLVPVSVIGVGFTRVFLGVHWPTDVLAGWLLGGAVVAACTAVAGPEPRPGPGAAFERPYERR